MAGTDGFVRKVALLAALLLAEAVCAQNGRLQQVPVAVLAYLDGRGDLAAETRRRSEALGRVSCPLPLAVCVVGEGLSSRPLLRRGDAPLLALRPPSAGASSQQALLRDYLQQAAAHCPPGAVYVWLRGHGLPPLAGNDERGAYRLLTGTDPGLTVAEFRHCLRSALGTRPPGPVVLETCFAASLEVCWELSPVASQLVALYGQAAQPGLEWERLLAIADRNVAQWQPAGACVYDLSRMDQVRRAFDSWCHVLLQEGAVASFARAAQWTRQQRNPVPLWQSCDLGTLVGAVEAESDRATIKDACGQLLGALRQLVQWPKNQDAVQPGPLGITLFVPPLPSARVESYVRRSALGAESSYGQLLREYVEFGEGLLPVAGG